MILRTTPAANADVAYLAEKWELDRPGFGAKFLAAYRTAVETVARFPRFYPIADDGIPGVEVRNAVLGRFELRMLYVVLPAEAVIVAVSHARRRPGSWHHRLTDTL